MGTRQTHCPQGHPYAVHAYINARGRRRCNVCFGKRHIQRKVCTRCKIEKPIDQFHPRAASSDGHTSQCASCGAESCKARRDKRRVDHPPAPYPRWFTHRATATPEYGVWKSMKSRCYRKKDAHYDRYGGRGITVYKPWRISFATWLAYMGQRPGPRYSIDRFPDNNGNYEPGNVRWATRKQQMQNISTNHWVTFRNRTMVISDWDREFGVSEGTVRRRIEKYGVEIALTMRKWSHGKT